MNSRGMALLTGLILLAAISLLAVTAAGSMTLQRSLAANFEDKSRAAANAELAESYARAWLFSRTDVERESGCLDQCLLPEGILQDGKIPHDPEFEHLAWWHRNGAEAGKNPVTGESTVHAADDGQASLWVMEELHFEVAANTEDEALPAGVGYYRIFSRGAGIQPGSTVVTETIIARPWGGEYQPSGFPPEEPLSAFCRQFDGVATCGTVSWRSLR